MYEHFSLAFLDDLPGDLILSLKTRIIFENIGVKNCWLFCVSSEAKILCKFLKPH